MGVLHKWRRPIRFLGQRVDDQTRRVPVRVNTHRSATATAAPVFAPAPTNLRATLTGTTVQLNWDQPPGAFAWPLEAGSGPALSDIAVVRTIAVPSLIVTGVPQGVYYVRVRSAPPDFSDLSAPSNEITVVVSGCGFVPSIDPPSDFSARVDGNNVTLSWSPPRFPTGVTVTSYVLEVGSAAGLRDVLVFDTRSAATSLPAIAPNGVYFARLYARTPCGTSAPSTEIRVVVPQPPTSAMAAARPSSSPRVVDEGPARHITSTPYATTRSTAGQNTR